MNKFKDISLKGSDARLFEHLRLSGNQEWQRSLSGDHLTTTTTTLTSFSQPTIIASGRKRTAAVPFLLPSRWEGQSSDNHHMVDHEYLLGALSTAIAITERTEKRRKVVPSKQVVKKKRTVKHGDPDQSKENSS